MMLDLLRVGLMVCGLVEIASASRADWVSVISRNRPASVLLKIEDGSGKPGFGSGTIIDPYGHVLTARHLLATAKVRSTDTFEVSGLVGWSDPSIDFSKATDLIVDYISEKYDLAILHFQSVPPVFQPAFARSGDLPDGTAIIVMGYPGGGNLTSTVGIVSGSGGSGEIKTDARVEKGNSGCPVFDEFGNFAGMLIQGSRNEGGVVQLGYFLTTAAITSDIATSQPPFAFQSGAAVAAAPVKLLNTVNLSFPVDETKSDHASLSAASKSYSRSYQAQPGYKIISAAFHASSASHVSAEPQVTIAPSGKSATINFGLESGPVYDQWPGWLSGSVVLKEVRE